MAVILEVRDVEDVPALIKGHVTRERMRIVDQLIEQVFALHKEQVDELGVPVGREQNVTVADVDPRPPPPHILTAPGMHGLDLVPEITQIGVGFCWMIPLPQKCPHHTAVRGRQVFKHGQMSATVEWGRQLYPRNVPVACAPLAELDEIFVRRLERADPGHESTTRRPMSVGPVATTAHRPTQALEMCSCDAVIEHGPRLRKERD
ncbi:hypothetical protein ABN034_20935 [Actinopolymorpha sp. B11F2]|uniref:hypothetical protein n=1 Tax=Actinopolymorpha sp. B11F2 TaxID=3160862 RepID=UPI0032E434DB